METPRLPLSFHRCGAPPPTRPSPVHRLGEAQALKEAGGRAVGGQLWTEAREAYERAVRLLIDDGYVAPEGREAEARALVSACTLNLALVHLKLERWAEAEACATAVLAHDARSTKALYRRGAARLQRDEARAALDDLRAAAELEPRSAQIRAALADAKAQVGLPSPHN